MKTIAGEHAEGRNRTPQPYIEEHEPEKAKPGAVALLLREQGAAPFEHPTTLPGAVALSESAGVARELDLDAPAPGTAPALPPTPDAGHDDDAMIRTLDRIGKAALAWLDRGQR